MTEKQQDTIYAAYLGLCTLQRCMVKWGQDSDVEKTRNLLKEMGEAFPFIQLRVGASILR